MRERYHHHGWNLADDDVPRAPECDPLSSAQHRRWVKSLQSVGLHQRPDAVDVEEQLWALAGGGSAV